MPLTFNVTRCEDYESLDPDLTRGLVFECMAVAYNEITLRNYRDFWHRSCFWRKLAGLPGFNLATIKRYVGMTTNVSTEALDPWLRRQYDITAGDLDSGHVHMEYYPYCLDLPEEDAATEEV
jgi:hypothetical protein